jgi:hypothetical protein
MLPHLVKVKIGLARFIDAFFPESNSLGEVRKSLDVVDRGHDSLLAHESQPHLKDYLASNCYRIGLVLKLIMNHLVSMECGLLDDLKLSNNTLALLSLLHHQVNKAGASTITNF